MDYLKKYLFELKNPGKIKAYSLMEDQSQNLFLPYSYINK